MKCFASVLLLVWMKRRRDAERNVVLGLQMDTVKGAVATARVQRAEVVEQTMKCFASVLLLLWMKRRRRRDAERNVVLGLQMGRTPNEVEGGSSYM
jgi:hypothetical protein